MTSSNQKEVMGYLASFILFFVFSQNSLAQSTDTIASRTSDGEYLAHVKGSNPIGYHKHWVTNTPDDQYIRLTGYNSAMVGNIKTDRKDAVQIVR